MDVLGDMIVVFDEDLQVVWSWDTLDHLDVSRKALLGETYSIRPPALPIFWRRIRTLDAQQRARRVP